MELLGKTLGTYRIDRLLGEGGMGAVYQAFDLSLQREVAIKLIHPHLARRPDFRERFMQEARLMAHLDHPGIVRVYHLGVERDLLYLPMEYIKGGNLRQLLDELIRQRKWIPLTEAVLLVRQLCQTVEYAHQRGVLHRDIKPANLMLKPEPSAGLPFRVVLTDLGLAKLLEGLGITQEGTSLGTPAYMSPEQAFGQPTDQRSDVYSLGILLYELAVGRLPFPIRSLTEATRYHTQVPPPAPRTLRPDLAESLEQIILKALEKNPGKRFASAGQLESALAAYTIPGLDQNASVPTEIIRTEGGQESSLITEYEKSVIASFRPAEASLATVFDSGSAGARGLSVFGDLSIPPGVQSLIQVVNKDTSSRTVALPPGTVTLGRDKDNQIVLDDEKASRKHAQVSWDGTDYHVMDLNSSNGTFLENTRLLPGFSEIWRPDQVLRIGDTWLRIIAPSAEPQTKVAGTSALGSARIFHSSSGDGLISVAANPHHLEAQPGGTVTAQLSLFNQSPNVDHFSLSLKGIPGNWISNLPADVHLMPGEQKETAFTLQIPRTPESTSGDYEMLLRVTSERESSQFVEVKLLLTVAPYSQFEPEMQPQRLNAGQLSRITVSNQGNRPEKFVVQLKDVANELSFRPPQLEIQVPAGESAAKSFKPQLRQTRWIGGQKIHPFTASVRLPKGEPQTIHAEMLSRAWIPAWVPPLALLLCLALFGAAGLLYRQSQFAQQATLTASAHGSDLDGDGIILAEEVSYGCNPGERDSDGDALDDPEERVWGTNCNVRDSDRDSISDGDEVHSTHTNPMNADMDGDGLPDNVDPDPRLPPTPTASLTITPSATPATPSATPGEEESAGQSPAAGGGRAPTPTNTAKPPPPSNPQPPNPPPAQERLRPISLYDEAPKAVWTTGPADITFGAPIEGVNDFNGFAMYANDSILEDGTSPGRILYTHPSYEDDGWIRGFYPEYFVAAGQRFKARIGLRLGSDRICGVGDVRFALSVESASFSGQPLGTWPEVCDGGMTDIDIDLSSYAGQHLRFRLDVYANGPSAQDWAVWVNPRVE